jgi:type VI secretion system protein ImpA
MTDIESLLAPISDASPCGEDLSFSPEFDAIQEDRRSDDATLDQGEWVTDLKTADWTAVIQKCSELLSTRCKDLRLTGWMAEALTRTEGFAGLAAGYQLMAGLFQRYGDCVHPGAEEEDQELRIGSLNWLLVQSMDWVRTIPLTSAPQGSYDAIAIEAAARAHQGSDSDNHPDSAQIDAARTATPFEFYQRLAEQIPLAQAALDSLEAAAEQRLAQEAPSFTAARDTLNDVAGTALRMAAAVGVSPDQMQAPQQLSPAPEAASAPAAAQPSAPQVSGEITSRKEALLQLRRVADFFRRTEPHSPVAYLAEKAARWGNMPLHVWLKTVLKDNPALEQLEDLLDVGADEPTNGG